MNSELKAKGNKNVQALEIYYGNWHCTLCVSNKYVPKRYAQSLHNCNYDEQSLERVAIAKILVL